MTEPETARRHRDRFFGATASAYDAIVVGTGPGGLVAAALLARAGRRVLALDAHYVAGGNATVFRRKEWEFDVGIHYLGDCGPNGMIPRILRACGADDVRFRPMEADLEQIDFPDFRFVIPRGKQEFRARLLDAFPGERRGIDRYLSFLAQVDRIQAASQSGSRWQQLKALPRCPLVLRYMNRTLGELLDSCTTDVRLRAVLTAQNGTYAIAPGRVSAVLHAGLQNHYFVDGGWYPEGGGQVIADRLADAIEAAGGHIRLRSRVTRIHVERGRVSGVSFDRNGRDEVRVTAPVVVSNADLKRTVLELVGAEHFPPAYVDRVRGFEMALPLFVVFLGLDLPVSRLPYGNVNRWLFSGYDFDSEYRSIERGEMPAHPFLYIATASRKDPDNPRIAPAGCTNLQLMTVVPAAREFWGVSEDELRSGQYQANEAYQYRKQQLVERMLDEAERAIPGLRGRIVFREASTPMTHTRYTGSTGGTSYGIAATPAQFLQKRPGAATPIEGLFLAGASTRSGHGIAGALLSGVMAADRILRDGTARRIFSTRLTPPRRGARSS